MNAKSKVVAIGAALLGVLVVSGGAAELGNGEWLSFYRDPANSVNTPVRLTDDLNVLWEAPAGGPSSNAPPLVYDGKVISGERVYDAWSGALLDVFPDAGPDAAVTMADIDGVQVPVLLTARSHGDVNDGYEYFAYSLDTYELLWSYDSEAPNSPLTVRSWLEINARDGVFLLRGSRKSAAVTGAGNVLWEKEVGGAEPPAAARVWLEDEDRFEDVVYIPLCDASGGGMLALRVASGEQLWKAFGADWWAGDPSVDESRGLVYAEANVSGPGPTTVRAFDAATGAPVWEEELDRILNGPPTLGIVRVDGTDVPAIFCVTGGVDDQTSVYAFRRTRDVPLGEQRLLWHTVIQSADDAWTSATYSGGKLYFGANDGRTYILEANTGHHIQTLETGGRGFSRTSIRVIVEVLDDESVPQSVMYYLTESGNVAAWSKNGSNPPPPVLRLTVEADPQQITPQSSSTVTATLIDVNTQQPVGGYSVAFSTDAGNNQGYVSPASVVTGLDGTATTTFYSGKREGCVTVTASTSGTDPATVAITVAKSGGEEPPPQTGSLQGTVYGTNGKPAKGATVTATGPSTATTATNPKGKYTINGLLPGSYLVEAQLNGAVDVEFVTVVGGKTTTVQDLHLAEP